MSPSDAQNTSKILPKTCLICFKSDSLGGYKDLFELWLVDTEQTTLLDKLQSFLQDKLWVNECTVLCECCIKYLKEAFHFKNKLLKSQEIWKTTFIPIITPDLKSNDTNQPEKLNDRVAGKIYQDEAGDISTPICNYEIEIEVKNLKAADLANNSLLYFSCKNCEAVFANGTEFSGHKCDEKDLKAISTYSSGEESDSKLKKQNSDITKQNNHKKVLLDCDLCGKKFKDLHGKNRHKVKVHFQEKVFPCTFCSKSFKQKYHLKEHLTSHTGEKSYKCLICNKTFQRISSQRRHIRSHEKAPGKKVKKTPFLCTICGKSFPFSNGVQRHMRIHTGEKKYQCNICERKFMQSTHLQVHIRTHTGEKPYMCNFCGEAFALKSALQKHIGNSHSAHIK